MTNNENFDEYPKLKLSLSTLPHAILPHNLTAQVAMEIAEKGSWQMAEIEEREDLLIRLKSGRIVFTNLSVNE